jgi:hypothetical protein
VAPYQLLLSAILLVAVPACATPGGRDARELLAGSPRSPRTANSSWMLPEAKDEALLYTGDEQGQVVYVFSLSSRKLVGMLPGFG